MMRPEAAPADGRLGGAAVPLRLLMALFVAGSHSFTLAGHHDPLYPNAGFGSVGVVGFFALSGFLVTGSALRLDDRARFLWHRFLRIYPAYWTCLIVSAVLFGLPFAIASGAAISPGDVAGYVLDNGTIVITRLSLVGEPFGVPASGLLNGSLWTLGIEVGCYLIVAFTMARRRAVAPMVALVLWVAATYCRVQVIVFPQLDLGLAFALGATMRLYRFPRTSAVVAGSAIVTVGGIALGWWLPLAMPALAILIVAIADREAPVIPDLSYGFYLYAFPMQQAAVLVGVRDPLLILGLAVMGALGLAALSYRFIEQPALRLRGASPPRWAMLRPART